MNAIHSHSVRFFLLLSFALSGAARSASTLQTRDMLDARIEGADTFERHVGRVNATDTGAIAHR